MRSLSKNLLILFSSVAIVSAGCKTGKDATQRDTKTHTSAQSSTKSEKKEDSETDSKSNQKLREKYAELLGVPVKDIDDISLYAFIDEWYGVPYQYGGKTKKGIDCSGFTTVFYKEIYKRNLSGTSSSLFQQCDVVSKGNLKPGDLVFFKIEQKSISHIGIYLQNNKFIHATTKRGVMIDDLDEAYYKKYFYKAGRPKSDLSKR
jgi:lipoprotein Spr